MRKAICAPVYFAAANERERGEFQEQLGRLREMYGDVAEFLAPVCAGDPLPKADAVVFPQLIGAAFKDRESLKKYNLTFVVLTSRFGTVEMWDWEIVSFLRGEGLTVFSPYNAELAKVILRAIAAKSALREGAKFVMFQDSPGEGMQAYIFKRFYWWEEECTRKMEDAFGMKLIYRSWKEAGERARAIPDGEARKVCADWNVNMEGVPEGDYLRAVKIYIAVKAITDEIGGVAGVGANCLNESFNCDTTPCLAWNMLFERDGLIWACEGDTLTLLSTYILHNALGAPMMMTNIYPFLVGMAALAHEKIDKFPDIPDPANHALGVHCGYCGFAPRSFCSRWVMRPKVLEIVNDRAIVIDCEFPKGPATLAKIYADFNKLSIIRAEIEDYVQYPGSDCRNGTLIRYNDGERVMDELCSHHALLITGDHSASLRQLARVFGWEAVTL
ncbi:MAG: hypothetical protein LBS35_10005 [Synergistaceae bacterium]|jgi:hypothetical protein|nr:hypothetical protein [Synergistaceae bacterium]